MSGFSARPTEGYGLQNNVGERGLGYSHYFSSQRKDSCMLIKLTTENRKLKQSENEKEYRLNNIQRELARVQKQNETLKQETEKQIHIFMENVHRSQQIYTLEREKSELEQKLKEHENSVRESRQQEQKLKTEKIKLEQKLQEQNKSGQDSRLQVEQLEIRNLQLEQALLECEQIVEDSKREVHELEKEKRQLKQALQEQEKSVRESKHQLNKLGRENSQLEQALHEHEKVVRDSRQQIRQLEGQKLGMERTLQEHETSVRDSRQQVHELERDKRQLKLSLQEQEKSALKVQQQLTKVEREKNALKRSEINLQIRLDREERKRMSIHNCPDMLEAILACNEYYGIRTQSLDIVSKKRECEELYWCESDLEAETNTLRDRCRRTEEFLENEKDRTCHLQEVINNLQSDNASYKNAKEILETQEAQLKMDIILLEKKLRQKPQEINQHTCQSCISYRNEIIVLKTEVSNLRDRCKHTAESLEKSEKKTGQLQDEIDHLKSDNVSYLKDIERLTNQANQLKGEIQLLEGKQRQKPTDIDPTSCQNCQNNKNEISNLKGEVSELRERCKRKDELLEKSNKTTRQLEETINHLELDKSSYKNDIENHKNQATKLKREIQLLEEQIRQKPSEIDQRSCKNCWTYNHEISDLKTEVNRLLQILKSKDEELQSHEKKLSSILSDNKDLTDKCTRKEKLLEKSEKNTRHLQDENFKLKSDNLSYQNDTDKLKSQATQLKSEIQLLEEKIRQKSLKMLPDPKSCQTCRNYRNETNDLKEEVINLRHSEASSDLFPDPSNCQHCLKYRKEISDLKVELNQLRDRLSEAAGNKLRDNNPNVADLSDMNRPTSLADKFSSFYTDEYTDAIEVIEGTMDEKESALFMLKLLKNCYDWSKTLAEEQRHVLSVESFGFMKKYLEQPSDFQLSDSCLIYVKDFQKKITTDGNNLRAVEMICLEDALKQANWKSNQNMKKYLKKCSQLCWMMHISDPPIYLNFDVKVGEKLDKNVYNVFTKSGSEIEFLVWPAMYINRTGPMLAKGVAQGK